MMINNSYNLVCTDGTVYHAKKENKTGSGGNSIVLEIDELPNCVAKIYESEPNNELRVKRFKYELEVMKKLSKAQYSVVPKIIVKGLIDSNDDHPFFIMEKHQTFKNKKPFLNNYSFENKVDLLIKICDKLMFIHKKGIYHRDIKPDNILFDSSTNDEPLLCDFGLAISDDRSIDIKTWDNENLGSYTFRPPELIGHHKNMRPSDYVWSDIYQFGKTAYAILKSCPKSFSDGCQIIDEDLEIDIYKDNLRIEYVYSMIEKSIVYDFHERITLQECKNELLKAKEAYQIDKTKLERNRFIRRVKGKISKTVNSTVLLGNELNQLFPTLFMKGNKITLEQPIKDINNETFEILYLNTQYQPNEQIILNYAGGTIKTSVLSINDGTKHDFDMVISELFIKNDDVYIVGFYKIDSENDYKQLKAKIDLQFMHSEQEITNKIILSINSND